MPQILYHYQNFSICLWTGSQVTMNDPEKSFSLYTTIEILAYTQLATVAVALLVIYAVYFKTLVLKGFLVADILNDTQGHQQWHHLIDHIWPPICVPLILRAHVVPFPRYSQIVVKNCKFSYPHLYLKHPLRVNFTIVSGVRVTWLVGSEISKCSVYVNVLTLITSVADRHNCCSIYRTLPYHRAIKIPAKPTN